MSLPEEPRGPHEPNTPAEPHGLVRKDSTREGYEVTDASIPGIAIFLIALAICAAVIFVVSYGLGKVINNGIAKADGPPNKWHAGEGQITNENLASDATLEQQQLRQMTESFPVPRMQTDNGDQDTADLHAREDLLLEHYSWVNQQQGKVRIPIARAMQLIAQHGLPVAPQSQTEPLMMGDSAPGVTAPLTNGFARTGYEQQYLTTLEEQRENGQTPPAEQAALSAGHR